MFQYNMCSMSDNVILCEVSSCVDIKISFVSRSLGLIKKFSLFIERLVFLNLILEFSFWGLRLDRNNIHICIRIHRILYRCIIYQKCMDNVDVFPLIIAQCEYEQIELRGNRVQNPLCLEPSKSFKHHQIAH